MVETCGSILFPSDTTSSKIIIRIINKLIAKFSIDTRMKENYLPDLTDSADDFVINICHHFAMMFHVDSSFNNVSAAAMGSSLFVHVSS